MAPKADTRPSRVLAARRVGVAQKNYGLNAAGKYARKRAYRDCCDCTPDGRLLEFDTDEAFLAFEEARFNEGKSRVACTSKPESTVPREQLALEYLEKEAAMNHDAVREEGNETREHQEFVAEGLHERHDVAEEQNLEILQVLREIARRQSPKKSEWPAGQWAWVEAPPGRTAAEAPGGELFFDRGAGKVVRLEGDGPPPENLVRCVQVSLKGTILRNEIGRAHV